MTNLNINKINFINLVLSNFFNDNIYNDILIRTYIVSKDEVRLYLKYNEKEKTIIIDLKDKFGYDVDFEQNFDDDLYVFIRENIIEFRKESII